MVPSRMNCLSKQPSTLPSGKLKVIPSLALAVVVSLLLVYLPGVADCLNSNGVDSRQGLDPQADRLHRLRSAEDLSRRESAKAQLVRETDQRNSILKNDNAPLGEADLRKRDQVLDSARRDNAEVQRQLQEHERLLAKKQSEIEEREARRQELQHKLNRDRLEEEKKMQDMQALKRARDEQREKDQQLVEDQKKSQDRAQQAIPQQPKLDSARGDLPPQQQQQQLNNLPPVENAGQERLHEPPVRSQNDDNPAPETLPGRNPEQAGRQDLTQDTNKNQPALGSKLSKHRGELTQKEAVEQLRVRAAEKQNVEEDSAQKQNEIPRVGEVLNAADKLNKPAGIGEMLDLNREPVKADRPPLHQDDPIAAISETKAKAEILPNNNVNNNKNDNIIKNIVPNLDLNKPVPGPLQDFNNKVNDNKPDLDSQVNVNNDNNNNDINNNNNVIRNDNANAFNGFNNVNNNFPPPEQQQFDKGINILDNQNHDPGMSNNMNHLPPPVGGMHLSWDWEDFSIMFNNYGGAEMKVRRSPHPSTGEPWPMPQYYSKKDNKVYKIAKDLRFVPTGSKCDILDEAMSRHLQRVLRGAVEDMYDNLQHAEGTSIDDPTLKYEKDEYVSAPTISRVEIKIRRSCDKYPTLDSDESYDLVVKKKKTYIWANEVWGAMRGLETLGQLVWKGSDGKLYIKETVISDYPRFPHRGLHIDTSRHFLFKEVLLDIIDSMEMNKLNVFHWHIVDDQSFPYESKVYPELSRKGAFHPTYVYTLEDIAEIIEYARLRGIRVMPEFDTPGHTYSWGLSRPELLTQCYSGPQPVKGYLGPIDPSKNSTYRFLESLFREIVDVFKDQYIHLGGDEVPLGCWQSNPEVMAFASEIVKKAQSANQNKQPRPYIENYGGWNGASMWSDDIKMVYEYYVNRLITILNDIGKKRKKGLKYIMWQEVMNNNLNLPNDTIIQVWMGDMADVMRATSLGYQVLYSTCWYLDHVEYGTKWPKYYNCDPVDQSYGYHIDEKKVLGGEIAFWSEYFSNENLIPLMWPRASAAAERLWSHKDVKNLDQAAERLSEHRCRMIKRGINAGEISGPGYCLHQPPKRRLFNDTVGCKGGNCSRTHNFVQIEDIELHLSHRGGSLTDCGQMFSRGHSSLAMILILSILVILALLVVTKGSSRLPKARIFCRNRAILLIFVAVLLVYFLCYTTIWMRGYEFSGSIHKTFQEDNGSGPNEGEGLGYNRPAGS